MQTAYTVKAKKAIDIATRISKSLHHSYIGTEHILLESLLKKEPVWQARYLPTMV